MDETAYLKERWFLLGDDLSHINVFNFIVKKYSEKHRRYHTLRHVKSSLEEFDRVKGRIENPRAMEYAIWFHDIEYNIFSGKNELISAETAERILSGLGVDEKLISAVYSLILATKHPAAPQSGDERYIADISLEQVYYGCEHYHFM